MSDEGKLSKIEGKVVTVDTKSYYQFETNHLSAFVVAEESVIDAAIKAQGEETDEEKTERIKKGVQDTTLKLKTTAAKRYITLTWTKSKGLQGGRLSDLQVDQKNDRVQEVRHDQEDVI